MKYIILISLFIIAVSCKKSHVSHDLCDCSDTPWPYTIDTVNIIVPNIITPNSDGRNDLWIIENLSQFEHKLTIKRPGILSGTLLKTDNYQNDWDGDGVKDGKYKYILEVEGNVFEGFLCILNEDLSSFETDCTINLLPIDPDDPLLNY